MGKRICIHVLKMMLIFIIISLSNYLSACENGKLCKKKKGVQSFLVISNQLWWSTEAKLSYLYLTVIGLHTVLNRNLAHICLMRYLFVNINQFLNAIFKFKGRKGKSYLQHWYIWMLQKRRNISVRDCLTYCKHFSDEFLTWQFGHQYSTSGLAGTCDHHHQPIPGTKL